MGNLGQNRASVRLASRSKAWEVVDSAHGFNPYENAWWNRQIARPNRATRRLIKQEFHREYRNPSNLTPTI